MSGFISYLRVSTKHQELGIMAQREAVRQYLGERIPLAEFVEEESGRSDKNRPQLQAALAECKRRKATLIIAKLDRLARNVHFISGLMESKVEFVAVDFPHANKLTLHILAAVAEHEREIISSRIKAALAEIKREIAQKGFRISKAGNRITRLGTENWQESLARARRVKDPRPPSPTVTDLILYYRSQGMTLRAIAAKLNHDDHRTPKGSVWYASTVNNVLRDAETLKVAA
jgi:DNA invertase Pin-like site-specific DNA recombinase